MIPKECKRLAEVDFPIAEVSRHAAREKSIRHGHPSTLHLWWARRPLASSRAVLLALLLPDPCDPLCPGNFSQHAREILLAMTERPSGWDQQVSTDEGLRRVLLRFIADFANWDNSATTAYVATAKALVQAAHPKQTPLVVDPFAGGGSIPLEALRLGCDAFASDLNPVACFILKVMFEDIPRNGRGLAKEVRRVGAAIKGEVKKKLADLYPLDPDGATPVAYLWARTVRCEAPDCGAEIPLMRSMWLCNKATRKWALSPMVNRPEEASPSVKFEIFEPKTGGDVVSGTVSRAKATCVCCRAVMSPDRVRAQLAAQLGGANVVFDDSGHRIGGARMTAVVTIRPGEKGRHYRLSTDSDYVAVRKAQDRVATLLEQWDRDGRRGFCPVPEEPMPPVGTLGFRVQRYGVLRWGSLLTARQVATLVELSQSTAEIEDSVRSLLAIAVDRVAGGSSSTSAWLASGEEVKHAIPRQALPFVWDFGESNCLATASRSWDSAIDSIVNVLDGGSLVAERAQVQVADATDHPLPDESAEVWFTDPPYYDAIPYADLSDFFLVWLKRSLPNYPLLDDPFDSNNPLSPKSPEVVQDETKVNSGRRKDRGWFEERMALAFTEGRRILNQDGVGSVVFAHKSTEGWEALLSGMIRGGWIITGSWPIATEMPGRLRSQNSAALATSIHLVCRPRSEDAPVGDWADVLRELPIRVADWMQRLQREGIRGADLVFACVGPALEIYSRYSRVETPEGGEVVLRDYLEKVWEVVGREALEQVLGTAEAQARNGMSGALEEDARLTALFLWTMQTAEEVASSEKRGDIDGTMRRVPATYNLPFDVVRRFAQPLGIHLDDWQSRIIDMSKGVVRLTPVRDRSEQLFGESGPEDLANELESSGAGSAQLSLFPEAAPQVRRRPRRGQAVSPSLDDLNVPLGATTLDRVHAAMLLLASGRTEALRALIRSEQERGPDFLRLANALSALYPRGSDEKRLLDAMLLAAPR